MNSILCIAHVWAPEEDGILSSIFLLLSSNTILLKIENGIILAIEHSISPAKWDLKHRCSGPARTRTGDLRRVRATSYQTRLRALFNLREYSALGFELRFSPS